MADSSFTSAVDLTEETIQETSTPTKSVLSISDVKDKLLSGELLTSDPDKKTSDHWKRFKTVVDGNGTFQKYIQCQNCKKVSFYMHNMGTNGLKRHRCIEQKSTLMDFVATNQSLAISKDAKDYLTEKATLIATTDLRPFKVIEGEGFHQFIDQVSGKVIFVVTAYIDSLLYGSKYLEYKKIEFSIHNVAG